MATANQVSQFRRANASLSRLATRDVEALWSRIGSWSIERQRVFLEEAWPALIDRYGDLSAIVAADMVEEWLYRPTVVLVDSVDAERANARMRWAIGTSAALGNLRLLADELVKQPGRSTIRKSAEASGAGWARVPVGSKTCAFCRMLASRGAAYNTKETAGGEGRKFHGDCDCTVIAVRDDGDYPDGYNPDALYDRYDLAVENAGRRPSTKKILSELRKLEGSS